MCRRYYQGYCRDKDGNEEPVKCRGDIFNCDHKKKEEPKLASKQGSTTGGITRDEVLEKIQGGTKMAENNVIATNEWYAQQIRKVGEFLMKNADLLVPDVKETFGIDIQASINPMEQTEIKVENRFVPKIK